MPYAWRPRITEAPGLSLLCPNSGVSQQVSDTEPAQTHNFITPALPHVIGGLANVPPRCARQLVRLDVHQADVAAACRTAVATWFSRVDNAFAAVALVAVAAAARYGATLPRPAALGTGLLLPGMRRRAWLRLVRLAMARAEAEFGQARPGPGGGGVAGKRIAELKDAAEAEAGVAQVAAEQWRRALTTRAVRDMTGYLTCNAGADAAGRIGNIGRLIASYAKWHGVSEATAYRHWRVVRELGLVRQTQHSAPGEHARYILCFPPAQVPNDLPILDVSPQPMDLAAHLQAWDDHADQALEEAAELELVRYGAATSTRTATATSAPVTGPDAAPQTSTNADPDSLPAYYCKAFPLYAKAKNPSAQTWAIRHPKSTSKRRGGRISDDERANALTVLSDCVPRWVAQRGPNRLPSDAELERMVPLLVLVLRHIPPSEVIELLTTQVRSADSLAGVLTWRLGRTLRALRATFDRPVDDDGEIYAATRALHAAEAAVRHERTATARQAAKDALHAALNRIARRRSSTAPRSGLDISWAIEPEQPTTPPVDTTEADSRHRHALALARARREKISNEDGWGQDKIAKPPAFTT